MKNILLAIIAGSILTACATPKVGDANVSVSSFDNSKTIAITPYKLSCPDFNTCATLGFAWRETNPNTAGLLVQVNNSGTGKYNRITALNLNIDGQVIKLAPHDGDTNNFDHRITSGLVTTETSRLFSAELDTLAKVKRSNTTKFQIVADGKIIEGDFKNTRAYQAMVNFLDQVNTNK